jgi:hypothetical protein
MLPQRKENFIMATITFGEHVIGDSIRELIEKIKSNIDLEQVRAVCKEQHGIETVENIDLKDGDIVTHRDQVAFKLDFEIRFVLPMLIDLQGNCISVLPAGSEKPSTPEERIEEAGSQAASTDTDF